MNRPLSPEGRRRLRDVLERSATPFPPFPDGDDGLADLQVELSVYESDASQDAFTALDRGEVARPPPRRPDLRARIVQLTEGRPRQAGLMATYLRLYDEADGVIGILEELYRGGASG